jgi:FMN phosphatase YigB (HAD superfamily)
MAQRYQKRAGDTKRLAMLTNTFVQRADELIRQNGERYVIHVVTALSDILYYKT